MEIPNILVFPLIFSLISATVITNVTESNVSLIPLKYKLELEFLLPNTPERSVTHWPTPGVLTIRAEALHTSNEFRLIWKDFVTHHLNLNETLDSADSLKVNVTNLSGNKTILVSNVSTNIEDEFVSILLAESFQAGDHLEVVVYSKFEEMTVYTYNDEDYDTSSQIFSQEIPKKFVGVYKPLMSVPVLSYGDQNVPIQFTEGIGGIWNQSHKVIGSFNSPDETNDRWTQFDIFKNAIFFISEFVNYTVSTERNTKVSVWGPPSVIFQNGATDGSPTEFANFTLSSTSFLLNNYERKLDMKYPLDELQIIFLKHHRPDYLNLGQIFLNQRDLKDFSSTSAVVSRKAKKSIKKDLSRGLALQFIPLKVHDSIFEWTDLTDYVENLCGEGIMEEKFDNKNLLNLLEGFLTPERVLDGIRIYLKSHIWKRATETEFLIALEDSISTQNGTDLQILPTSVRVNDVIGDYQNITWYNRQVNASLLQAESNHIQLSIGYRNEENASTGFQRWLPVQIKIAISLDNSTQVLEETFWIPPNTLCYNITKLGGHTLTNSSDIQWLLVNKNRNGLYSTFYDPTLLSRLVAQLNKNCSVFSPRERYNILMQCKTSNLYLDIPLENFFILTGYFGQETESHLWADAMSKLRQLRFLYLGNDEAYEEVRKHFVPKIESYLDSRGGLENIVNSEEGLTLQFRDACRLLRAPSCLRFASENLEKFEFTREIEEMAWFKAAGADPTKFEYLNKQFFQDFEMPQFRRKYFEALEWTSNETLYETFLNSVIINNTDSLIFERFVGGVALSQSRLALLTNFAKTKFQDGLISSFVFENIAHYVLNHYQYSEFVADRNLYEELKLYINANQEKLGAINYSSLQKDIIISDEKVYSNDSYWNRNGDEFLSWLKVFNKGYTSLHNNTDDSITPFNT